MFMELHSREQNLKIKTTNKQDAGRTGPRAQEAAARRKQSSPPPRARSPGTRGYRHRASKQARSVIHQNTRFL